MHLAFVCPVCEKQTQAEFSPEETTLQCAHCEWSRTLDAGAIEAGIPHECLACGCEDLWKQRDFPQKLGVTIVASAAILSSIAWYFMRPMLAIGILMGFGALDFILYIVMPDVLVCYRCHARYRFSSLPESVPYFSLETAERYRQESQRLSAATEEKSPS